MLDELHIAVDLLRWMARLAQILVAKARLEGAAGAQRPPRDLIAAVAREGRAALRPPQGKVPERARRPCGLAEIPTWPRSDARAGSQKCPSRGV